MIGHYLNNNVLDHFLLSGGQMKREIRLNYVEVRTKVIGSNICELYVLFVMFTL